MYRASLLDPIPRFSPVEHACLYLEQEESGYATQLSRAVRLPSAILTMGFDLVLGGTSWIRAEG